MFKILCDSHIPFLRGTFEPYAIVRYVDGALISHADAMEADALIIRTRTRCDHTLLHDTPIRAIASATIGYDHIDTTYCDKHGIAWSNAPGCNSASVRQWVGGCLEALAHKLGFRIQGLTLGIVGVGNVGSKVAELATGMGMKTLLCDPPRALHESGFVGMDRILAEADIVTLHTPLTDSTRHMIGAEQLKAMKRNSILINSSRGEVVDNSALLDALRAGTIKAAALDVWEDEPHIIKKLLEEVTIATPHIAGYSADGKAAGTSTAVRFIAKSLDIEPLKSWTAQSIPPAHEPVYDILQDDAALRSNPQDFERLRSEYPVRREPLFKTYR